MTFGERWTCPRCGRAFAARNQTHACGRWDLERHLGGKPEVVVATFWAVVDAARAVGPFELIPEKTRVALHAAHELRRARAAHGMGRRARRARAAAGVGSRFARVETYSPRNSPARLFGCTEPDEADDDGPGLPGRGRRGRHTASGTERDRRSARERCPGRRLRRPLRGAVGAARGGRSRSARRGVRLGRLLRCGTTWPTREPVRALADPWITLAAVAVATERLVIGTLVTPLARRRAHQLARETVKPRDRLSGGRLVAWGGARERGRTGEFDAGRFGEEGRRAGACSVA